MIVRRFLQDGGTLEDLEAKYSIKAKRHTKEPGLVLLKYNQISSPFTEPLVRECRGVILDEQENWQPVSRSFDKFFNHGEQLAAPIDWGTARVQEKVDGSLCTLYHYQGQWHVATTGTPDASGPVEGNVFTFAELFWKTLGEHVAPFKPEDVMPAATNRVFMFELTSPYNRVVVPHVQCRLTLLAVRNMDTMQEESPELWAEMFSVPAVKDFGLQSFDDILASFEELDPLRQEGYVVVDGAFQRVKVKHPGYVAIHHLKGDQGPTPKRMLEIVRTGEGSELLAHFPEWRPVYDQVAQKLGAFESSILQDFERITSAVGPEGTQKDFALLAKETVCPAALFQLRAGKAKTVREFLNSVPLDRLAEWAEVFK